MANPILPFPEGNLRSAKFVVVLAVVDETVDVVEDEPLALEEQPETENKSAADRVTTRALLLNDLSKSFMLLYPPQNNKIKILHSLFLY
jgi:hypothetical protein